MPLPTSHDHISDVTVQCLGCGPHYSRATSPVLLPCLHTVCKPCLERPDRPGNTKCHSCENEIAGKSIVEKTEDPTIDYSTVQAALLLDLKRSQGIVDCDDCPQLNKATPRCLSCRMYMCDTCRMYHLRYSRYFAEAHKVISLVELLKSPDSIFNDRLLCQSHWLEQTLYCKRCDVTVCSSCCLGNRAKHAIDEISSHYDEFLRNVSEKCEQINNDVHKINTSQKHLLRQGSTCFSQSDSAIDVIEATVKLVLRALEQRKELLLRHLHMDVNEHLQVVGRKKAVLKSRIQAARITLRKGETVLDMCSPDKFLATHDAIKSRLNFLTSQSPLKYNMRSFDMRLSGLNDTELLLQEMCTVEERLKVPQTRNKSSMSGAVSDEQRKQHSRSFQNLMLI
ncbi:E3 ubiquitin-protein ligase TRIM45-like [Haliotis cracherodii]|uniref:E3 ubiquitin-protein ligase TRIM45-like n=1 Tax=Haliotis cracherodii TaxID=6455 RepID=UPI0039EA2A23